MTASIPPMMRQSELTQELVTSLTTAESRPWDELRYRVRALKPVLNEDYSVSVGDSVFLDFAPRGTAKYAKELRALMYRPGAGTWFEMELIIEVSGRVTTRFNYDEEPVQDRPFGPTSYAIDQDAFPRDVEHQPPWLQAMIEAGRRKIADAANVRFVDGALVLQTTKAWGVLQDDATAAGLRDHPDLADLFADDASGTDDDIHHWYATFFPIVYPGATVTAYEVIPRSVDQITLTGDPDTLQHIAKQPW